MSHTISKGRLRPHTQASDLESNREETIRLIREDYERDEGSSVEDQVIRGAQALLLKELVSFPSFEPVKKPADRRAFETLAKAWLVWAAGGDPQPTLPKSKEFGGALHMMALEPWGEAIRALSNQNTPEAKRLFRRALELGTQYGTDTNDAIHWAFLGSFYA